MSPDASPIPPWEQSPDESAGAFHAFTLYRNLGEARSLSRVASDLIEGGRRSGNPGTVRKHLGEWSSRYRWVERAQAYDRELDRQLVKEEQVARTEMRRRQAKMAEDYQEALSVPMRALLAKIRSDPGAVDALAEEDLPTLLSLVSQAAKAVPAVVVIERDARGPDQEPRPKEDGEDRCNVDVVIEEQRLRRVARIMMKYGLMPADEAAVDGSTTGSA